MGLIKNPTCRKSGADEETSAPTLCECESLASLRHAYLGPVFLDLEDIKSLSIGAIWNFNNGTGLLWPGIRLWGTKGPFLRPRCIGPRRARTELLI